VWWYQPGMDGHEGRVPVGRPAGRDLKFVLPIVAGVVNPDTYLSSRSQLRLRVLDDGDVRVSIVGAPLKRSAC